MNVLLITTDQQKATTVGAYGDPLGTTPHIDRLAAEGTRYARACTQNPFCQPARASILTGTYPSTHGVVRNGIDLPADAAAASVATHFTEAGFATALFGKAHFASYFPDFPTGSVESVPDSALVDEDWYGPYFGFEHVELTLDVHNVRLAPHVGRWNWGFGPPPFGLHYARHLFRDGRDRGIERLRLLQPEASGGRWDHTQTWDNAIPEEDHHTTWIADRAIRWLEDVDAPFFAWVSFADPHHPFDPPRPWCDRFTPDDMGAVLPEVHPGDLDGKPPMHEAWARGFRGLDFEWTNPGWTTLTGLEQRTILAAYHGMIAQCDHNIGRILHALESAGLDRDTLVVFTVDHGDFMGEHRMMLKGPIHYQALLRVPLVMRGPGVPVGTVVDDPVGTIDVAPSALDACGLPVPDTMEGRPLRPTSPDPSRREWVLTEDDIFPGLMEYRTLTTRDWRVTVSLHDDEAGELYDLRDDPGELRNRWHDRACSSVRSDLVATLHDVRNHGVARMLPQVCEAG